VRSVAFKIWSLLLCWHSGSEQVWRVWFGARLSWPSNWTLLDQLVDVASLQLVPSGSPCVFAVDKRSLRAFTAWDRVQHGVCIDRTACNKRSRSFAFAQQNFEVAASWNFSKPGSHVHSLDQEERHLRLGSFLNLIELIKWWLRVAIPIIWHLCFLAEIWQFYFLIFSKAH